MNIVQITVHSSYVRFVFVNGSQKEKGYLYNHLSLNSTILCVFVFSNLSCRHWGLFGKFQAYLQFCDVMEHHASFPQDVEAMMAGWPV